MGMSRPRKNFAKPTPTEEPQMSSVPKALLQQARRNGQLNLSGRDFKEVPEQVWQLHAPPSDGSGADFDSTNSEKWWDQVELTKLILASNQLVSLSEKIAVFPALTVLDLHDNKLRDLPEAISSLKILEKLDISHNELHSLPDGLCNLDRLVTLFMQHNKIVSLPKQFGHLSSIRNLDASNNQLQALPNDWSQIINLQKLNLSANQLAELPSTICRLPLLSYLDVGSNKLACLPVDWTNLSSLKELYLRSNCLSELPNLRDCGNLKELYCARNSFKRLEIGNLPNSLMIVEFRDNKITEIEEDIIQLKELQRFDLANNDISTLPPKMGTMEHVKALNVEGNPMRGIRRDIISKGTLAIMKYLRTRIVTSKASNGHHNGQSSLPMSSEVADHTKKHALATSKTLDLSKKPFTPNLLEDCGDIPLEVISMSKMGISEIPPGLSLFQLSLRSLDCSMNKISCINASIGGFMSLTHLNLASNLLVNLPAEFSSLQNLIELNIMQNRFKELPDCIFMLSCLEHLLAGGNQIEKIDTNGLRKLSKLSTLSLQNNSISQVPPELGLISTLKNLQLEGNTFRIPRQNILQQGTLAVIEYLKGRVPNK